jgi:hypothetical protein
VYDMLGRTTFVRSAQAREKTRQGRLAWLRSHGLDVEGKLARMYLDQDDLGLSYLDRGEHRTFEESVRRARDPKRYAAVQGNEYCQSRL